MSNRKFNLDNEVQPEIHLSLIHIYFHNLFYTIPYDIMKIFRILSIYDAYLAGFEEVIFVIKRENAEDFHNVIGNRICILYTSRCV